jgi:membrane protein implicated in regulation of membrane protease activity
VSTEAHTRGLFIASLALSGVGVALLMWWVFGVRQWWTLVAGALAAIAGVAIAARARREPAEPPQDARH